MSKRDVSPFLKALRNFLLGRKHTTALRFQQDIASRSPAPPNLPDGCHHRLATNYYYPRDARREVQPPVVLVEQVENKKIAETENVPKLTRGKTPGNPYAWD